MEDERTMPVTNTKRKREKKNTFLIWLIAVSALAALGCVIAYNVIGSHVSADGAVVEPFGFIPLAFLFSVIALAAVAVLVIRLFARHAKRAKDQPAE